MKNNSIVVSIIIATFNSHKTLPNVLEALTSQTFPKQQMEILMLDGGSTDDTRKIGKKFDAKIINNPRTEPVYAKYLGYKKARGKYIVYLDHDEVLENHDSIRLKVKILKDNPQVKAVVGSGYKNPPNYSFINNYINEFGDPFSFFIYNLSKDADFFIPTMSKRYNIDKELKSYVIYSFSKERNLPIIELCAAGSMFDAEYMKETFPQTLTSPSLIPHFFYMLIKTSPFLAVSKHDVLIHYSSDTIRKYFKKILWRVKNNIYHASQMGSAGFGGRQEFLSPIGRAKKYLFLPYAFSLLLPFFDSLYLVYTRKKLLYFIHIPLTLYTAYEIIHNIILRQFGVKMKLRSYDESKIVIQPQP